MFHTYYTADSAITGGVLDTDMPRLQQCDVGRRGKQSTQQTAVCDECCCTARLFSTEVRPHHTAAPGPSLVTRATAGRIQARCACLPLLAWYGSAAIPCTTTAPCGGHGLATATSFRLDARAEHSTNASCHRR